MQSRLAVVLVQGVARLARRLLLLGAGASKRCSTAALTSAPRAGDRHASISRRPAAAEMGFCIAGGSGLCAWCGAGLGDRWPGMGPVRFGPSYGRGCDRNRWAGCAAGATPPPLGTQPRPRCVSADLRLVLYPAIERPEDLRGEANPTRPPRLPDAIPMSSEPTTARLGARASARADS